MKSIKDQKKTLIISTGNISQMFNLIVILHAILKTVIVILARLSNVYLFHKIIKHNTIYKIYLKNCVTIIILRYEKETCKTSETMYCPERNNLEIIFYSCNTICTLGWFQQISLLEIIDIMSLNIHDNYNKLFITR
jgi:hypothetical protein